MMFSFGPQTAVFIVHEAVDFRNGTEGLSALCRNTLFKDPLSGAVFVFRNRSLTSLKLLVWDGQGIWCLHKRLRSGKFKTWPRDGAVLSPLKAHELMVLIFNGNPFLAEFEPGEKVI
ncbi:MAG: IS66 family insertion sequence element accessory protein TnpB [Rhodocyclaceae bacterium]|nr:IS66 family insertion sequence element accessory protein TnpB [Rhodocyclaceae bacterium]